MSGYAPITADADWFVGEDVDFDFLVRNPDGTPAPVDGTWTFEWAVRVTPDAAAAALTIGNDRITRSNAGDEPHRVRVRVLRADTINLRPGEYVHALRRTNANASAVVSHGPAVLKAAATR